MEALLISTLGSIIGNKLSNFWQKTGTLNEDEVRDFLTKESVSKSIQNDLIEKIKFSKSFISYKSKTGGSVHIDGEYSSITNGTGIHIGKGAGIRISGNAEIRQGN
ncbi:hypothetical protein GW765_01885 [Candidatus Parcubacteria bacterium]|nr:hypothetical protein [Candidatus Parcubacteria bacterium]